MFKTGDVDKQPLTSAKPVEVQKTEAQVEQELKVDSASQRVVLEQEKTYRKGISSVLDIIAPESFKVNPSSVKIGDMYVRTLFVMAYPRYIGVGWFAPIINYNATIDISMFFYPMKSEVVLKQLRNKVGVLQAQLMTDAEKGAPRDPLRETALRDIEQKSFFNLHFMFLYTKKTKKS